MRSRKMEMEGTAYIKWIANVQNFLYLEINIYQRHPKPFLSSTSKSNKNNLHIPFLNRDALNFLRRYFTKEFYSKRSLYYEICLILVPWNGRITETVEAEKKFCETGTYRRGSVSPLG